MTQYHFLDDSGDPGLEGKSGSSSHFVLAMVQLPQRAPLAELESVRWMFHLPVAFEFKYYRTKPRQKIAFFEAVGDVPFRVRAVVVHKAEFIRGLNTQSGADFTIRFIVGLTLRSSELDIANDYLVVDGATRAFLQTLRIRFSYESRRLGRVRPFEKIVGGRSSSNEELQLADMIAGAVRQYVSGEDTTCYRMFASKIVDLWQIPEDTK